MSFHFYPYQSEYGVTPSALLDFRGCRRSLMRIKAELGFTIYFGLQRNDNFGVPRTKNEPKGAFILVTDNGEVVKLEYEDGESTLTHTKASAILGIGHLSMQSELNFRRGESDKFLQEIMDAVRFYSRDIEASRPKRVQIHFPWDHENTSYKCTKIKFKFDEQMAKAKPGFNIINQWDYYEYYNKYGVAPV